ncbi:Hypothetical protein PHPALM_10072 [Phytophthora palmivora]|uniref:Uncharacterized protein n=1 Tax=Phytophthora palmivora TaxID=4796 RepID=A0A2P4Y5L9_9STRA|nr:Hypothetical protein PHPALM_10072 [Phytophthora palmivora]
MDYSDEELAACGSSDDDEAFMSILLERQSTSVTQKRGGSVPGKVANIDRDFDDVHRILWRNYFAETPRYPEKYFVVASSIHSHHESGRCLFGEVVLRNRKIAGVLLHTAPELPTNGGGTPIFREVT